MMQATDLEYRHRFLVHTAIFLLGFWAPWHRAFATVQNHSGWFQLANALSRPHYQYFASAWNGILVCMVLFALAGAVLRIWAAAYLDGPTGQQPEILGDRLVADGPYRHLRHPLHLGTILWTVPLCLMMWPDAGVLTFMLVALFQTRLIAREQAHLARDLGPAYTTYAAQVPGIVPSPLPRVRGGNARPLWLQGALRELFLVGTVLSIAILGWTNGFGWETNLLRVLQGIVISFGLSVIARAFIPRASL